MSEVQTVNVEVSPQENAPEKPKIAKKVRPRNDCNVLDVGTLFGIFVCAVYHYSVYFFHVRHGAHGQGRL